MSDLSRRLDRLAVLWRAEEGCPTCREWATRPTIIRAVSKDGVIDGQSRPEVCPDCGKEWPATLYYDLVGFTWAELETIV